MPERGSEGAREGARGSLLSCPSYFIRSTQGCDIFWVDDALALTPLPLAALLCRFFYWLLLQLHANIIEKNYTLPDEFSQDLKNLLDQCFEFKPSKVCASAFFRFCARSVCVWVQK